RVVKFARLPYLKSAGAEKQYFFHLFPRVVSCAKLRFFPLSAQIKGSEIALRGSYCHLLSKSDMDYGAKVAISVGPDIISIFGASYPDGGT
ncbi:MAG: hypothetical protein K1V87_05785, partial [Muribaculum sp.]